jgi:transcriptional regulator with XRE-family HTH domain
MKARIHLQQLKQARVAAQRELTESLNRLSCDSPLWMVGAAEDALTSLEALDIELCRHRATEVDSSHRACLVTVELGHSANEETASFLAMLRRNAQLTQDDLGTAIDKGQSAIAKIESAQNRMPDAETIAAWAEHCGYNVSWTATPNSPPTALSLWHEFVTRMAAEESLLQSTSPEPLLPCALSTIRDLTGANALVIAHLDGSPFSRDTYQPRRVVSHVACGLLGEYRPDCTRRPHDFAQAVEDWLGPRRLAEIHSQSDCAFRVYLGDEWINHLVAIRLIVSDDEMLLLCGYRASSQPGVDSTTLADFVIRAQSELYRYWLLHQGILTLDHSQDPIGSMQQYYSARAALTQSRDAYIPTHYARYAGEIERLHKCKSRSLLVCREVPLELEDYFYRDKARTYVKNGMHIFYVRPQSMAIRPIKDRVVHNILVNSSLERHDVSEHIHEKYVDDSEFDQIDQMMLWFDSDISQPHQTAFVPSPAEGKLPEIANTSERDRAIKILSRHIGTLTKDGAL